GRDTIRPLGWSSDVCSSDLNFVRYRIRPDDRACVERAAMFSLSVGSDQEEHVRPLDEGTIVGLEAVLHELLRDAVRQLAGAEALLEAPAAGVEPRLFGRPLESPARPVEIAQDPLELPRLPPRLGGNGVPRDPGPRHQGGKPLDLHRHLDAAT